MKVDKILELFFSHPRPVLADAKGIKNGIYSGTRCRVMNDRLRHKPLSQGQPVKVPA